MKNNWIFSIVLFTFFLGACSNDLNLTEDWTDIPVVYALLNKNDETHYVRVEKAFLDPSTDAFLLAQEPDSIYYNNVSVALERESDGKQFQLERIDGNLVGLQKDDGVFANNPNYLYKIDASDLDFQSGEKIKLILNRGDQLPLVTAETTVLGDMVLASPSANPPLLPKLDFQYNLLEDIRMNVPDEASIFDVRLIIHYKEFEFADQAGTLMDKSLEWIWSEDSQRRQENDKFIKEEVQGLEFFDFLSTSLEHSEAIGRFFIGFEVIVTAAGEELATFFDIRNANTGLTSNQELPFYTNLSEGRGIFSSRNQFRLNGLGISPRTLDSLRNGIYTNTLNFQ